MNDSLFISIVMPTHEHGWEVEQAMKSLERQTGIYPSEYEIVIVDSAPDEGYTRRIAAENYRKYGNVRYIEVYDIKERGITNAGYCGNIGARMFAEFPILILIVDSARLVTPGAIRKTRDAFARWGNDITTTIPPYHIGKHYDDSSWTVKQCRELMSTLRWEIDAYHLFDAAAHTKISSTGNIGESTFQGITKENFIKIGGWNEVYKSWGVHNLDLWRRSTRPLPEGGLDNQLKNVIGRWGKVGLGLKVINIEDEGTFHIHHKISIPRNHGNFATDNESAWSEYDSLNECIVANINRPNWGQGNCQEINLSKI